MWITLAIKSTSRHLPAYSLFIINAPFSVVGWDVVSRPLAAIGWGLCVKKKYLETFVSHKKRRGGGVEGKKTPHPPHRCERRRQRQTSAQSCGSHWLALCTKSNSKQCTRNTPTNPEGVHAASSIAPPLSHRSPAWRTTTLHFNPRRRRRRACEDGSLRFSARLVLSYFSSRDAVFLRWLLLFLPEESEHTKNFTLVHILVSLGATFLLNNSHITVIIIIRKLLCFWISCRLTFKPATEMKRLRNRKSGDFTCLKQHL